MLDLESVKHSVCKSTYKIFRQAFSGIRDTHAHKHTLRDKKPTDFYAIVDHKFLKQGHDWTYINGMFFLVRLYYICVSSKRVAEQVILTLQNRNIAKTTFIRPVLYTT